MDVKQFHGIAAAVFAGAAGLVAQGANAQDGQAAADQNSQELDEVVVTGFRRSLADATQAKKESVGFVDSVFAEDIGKFPDTNIAESFNRIPGVTISREITGEGLNVAIRGLNTNFTRVLLNNAPVAIASTGQDNASQNREVDLDMFPSELFSQLTVAKSPTADLIEGGAAGTVNMRMARPFDSESNRLSYSIQGVDNSESDDLGYRGSLVGSWHNDTFGVLVGISGVDNKIATSGFETIGWTSLNLTQAQCGGGTLPCNTTGGTGAGPGQLTTVPNNQSTIDAGLTPGATIDNAFLLAQNPGRTIQQIDNALIPRLGRPMFDVGEKKRTSGVVSLEFRPGDSMRFFLDSMYGKKDTFLERADLMWAVRRTSQGGLVIPQNMQVDRDDCAAGCLVTSATYSNSLMMLEYRPYTEDLEFWGTNPGMVWDINEKLQLEVQGNYTESDFYRESPTVLVISQPTTVTYTNDGGIPTIDSSLDINDPATFGWLTANRGGGNEVGRVDMVDEQRRTETLGGRFSVRWGDDNLNVKFGGAWDEVSRDIRPLANTQQYQNATCGGNPSVFLPGPNTNPACRGDTAAQIVPGTNNYPLWAGLGTGYSSGQGPATWGGSLIPHASVPNFLSPTRYGFVSVNWDDWKAASNYDAIHDQIGESGSTPTTANWASIMETTTGIFAQLSGDTEIGSNRLRYNVGVRYVETEQSVTSRITGPDTRNPAPATAADDGARYPDAVTISVRDSEYSNVLPSANLAWNLTENAIIRAGVSRTMTRPNPGSLRSGISVPNADVSSATLGNPNLEPYLSDNIDVGFEYYTGNEGYFGVAAFRKDLEGFTRTRQTFVPFSSLAQYGLVFESLGAGQQQALLGRSPGNPGAAIVRLDETINADGRLKINGFEFNWVQPLDVIGLKGLGFSTNFTMIDQTGEGAAPAIATGVPPETFNATLYYEDHGISARVSMTKALGSQNTGPNSNQQGVTGAELFGVDYKQVDFSSSFDFGEMFGWSQFVPQLTIDAINVTGETRRSYSQFTGAAFTEFDSGRTVMVGLRGRF
jgi:TonB-dependent receptor